MRSTLAWVLSDMSPISSRKMVPPSARSNFPFFWDTAPVKAPRSWPNSSLSMSSSGIAAQLISMNGLSRRRLWKCTDRATSSLPVPFSPVMRTEALVGATIRICSLSLSIAAELPIISWLCSTSPRSEAFSSLSRVMARAFSTVTTTFSRESGFSMKS